MKLKQILALALLFAVQLFFSQTITFISEKTAQPLPQISVFGNDGSILAYSDIDGKIEKQKLDPSKENFQLVQDQFVLGTFTYQQLNTDVVKLKDRIKNIEAVTIKKGKPAKYVLVKGNFNTYITVNGKLNTYADGIATYIFDSKSGKMKSVKIEQYRVFNNEKAENNQKVVASNDFVSSLKLPDLQYAAKIDEYLEKRKNAKEVKNGKNDAVELKVEGLQNKEFSLFGYRFYDLQTVINYGYETDSKKTLRDLTSSGEVFFMKIKHKSEPEFSQVNIYRNFYVSELNYSDDVKIDDVKFDKDQSNYSSEFWKTQDFPNMQPIFSKFFKDDLKEKQNSK